LPVNLLKGNSHEYLEIHQTRFSLTYHAISLMFSLSSQQRLDNDNDVD